MSHYENNLSFVAYPTLQRLGVTIERLALLVNQGFIAREVRGGRLVYRLRYRDASRRQRTLNIPVADVAAVESELQELQSVRRARRRVAELDRRRRQLDRDRKELLAPLIAARGLKFHGRTIRAPRWRVVARGR